LAEPWPNWTFEWIAAHSPQAKGRIERMFGTLQDRLVKQMRWAEIDTLEAANRFLEITFWPSWEERFSVPPARSSNAHRSLGRAHRLEQILSVRVARMVASDHTVSWKAQRGGLRREDVCANQNPKPQPKSTTVQLPITLGGSPGSGHF
jgi:hypothetical protein